jgi:hypothetical protein
LDENHKLDPHPLDESLRPKSGKLRLNLHGTILEDNPIGSDPKKKSYQGELMICRIKMQARVQLKVQFASNGPKLVLRNLEPGPPSKVGLSLSLGPMNLIVHNGGNLKFL